MAEDYYIFSETEGIEVYIEVTGIEVASESIMMILILTFVLLL